MALSRMDDLYRQVILDHSDNPHHHGELSNANKSIELKNPTCGDVLTLDLDIENDVIKDMAFGGYGCTISQASASMMTDAVIGKKTSEAEQMVQTFSNMIIGEDVDTDSLEDAAVLEGVSKFPARIKCATLAWKALHKAMNKKDSE
ncbi:SUF system NifU family Fe-S cluster assembly protein [Companilactobacillus allii]|uniref:SUF system NifU family Fe-S cluster assembly protein n=1 Tax=Companilactobacillus allii TaxID=1847728 RepID=A0A1P8Q2F1_9LACO|nr:SUF system NifU family Fe-S cluster assembly protein [Companilactobacillus allii]APX72006.1 SUF system NifU family Fe-S cluster assembly protein [Companilactobacillus allii]USQ69099.1 SUF system NifU family Fe-S cluster assembly protein [Companilactobacillus allii]